MLGHLKLMSPARSLVVVLSLLAAVACLAIWVAFDDQALRTLLATMEQIKIWCAANPQFLFLAIVILPGLGFPVSPLWIIAGAVWGSNWQACAATVLAMELNMSWTYWLAAGPANALIARLLGSRWSQWRQVETRNLTRLAIILRITPGLPFVLQNYLLGLLGIPFRRYLLVSIPITSIFVIGFVLTGGAIFQGHTGTLVLGASLLIAATIGLHLLRAKIAKSRLTPEQQPKTPALPTKYSAAHQKPGTA
jgi:uncharacterized membrane protein YdjX (TVP38/TMEM64 family)